MKRVFFLAAVVAALLPGAASMARAQTEVSLLVPNPFRRTLDKVAGGFEPKTGYKLNITVGRGMGTRQQIARGEMFDVSILLPPYPEALASGNIDPKSATVLAKLVLAVGVKKGAAKPDVFSAEALKRTLLAAKYHRHRGPKHRQRRRGDARCLAETRRARPDPCKDQNRRKRRRRRGTGG